MAVEDQPNLLGDVVFASVTCSKGRPSSTKAKSEECGGGVGDIAGIIQPDTRKCAPGDEEIDEDATFLAI